MDDNKLEDIELDAMSDEELKRILCEQQEQQEIEWDYSGTHNRKTNENEEPNNEHHLGATVEIHNEEGEFLEVKRKRKRKAIHQQSKDKTNLGNDDNKFEVCISSKQILPKQIGLAKLLRSENVEGVIRIKYKGPYKVLICFENREFAEKILNNKKFAELDYRCQLTSENIFSYGIVRDVDLEIEAEELLESFRSDVEIVSIKRLKRLDEDGQWVDSEVARVCFKAPTSPPYVYNCYGYRTTVDPYYFPVSQCANCWKYGHLSRGCPNKKPTCPKCGDKHANCEIEEFTCINCGGPHMALDKSCPRFIKEKHIRYIMCNRNTTYRKALDIYLMDERENNEIIKEPEPEKIDIEFPLLKTTTEDISSSPVLGGNTSKERSYKDVLVTEVIVHEQKPRPTTNNTVVKTKANPILTKNREIRHPVQPKTPVTRKEEPIPNRSSNENESKRRFDLVKLIKTMKDIIISQNSFEKKLTQVIKCIWSECVSVIVSLVKDNEIMMKFLSFLNINNG